MATTVYGREGDDFIITRINFGHGDEYLVERREGAGYLTIYSGFKYEKALAILKRHQYKGDRRYTFCNGCASLYIREEA